MKKYLFLIIGLLLIISGIVYLMLDKSLPKSLQQSPKPSSIANPTPVIIDTYKGKVVSLNNSLVAINTGGIIKSFNISQTKDYQGVTYGTLEEGNAVSVKTTKAELKTGQEVYLIVQKNSNIVKSVYMFR